MLGKSPASGSTIVVDRHKTEAKQTEVRIKAPRKPRAKKEPEPAAVGAAEPDDVEDGSADGE
jgi:hypothetical protein